MCSHSLACAQSGEPDPNHVRVVCVFKRQSVLRADSTPYILTREPLFALHVSPFGNETAGLLRDPSIANDVGTILRRNTSRFGYRTSESQLKDGYQLGEIWSELMRGIIVVPRRRHCDSEGQQYASRRVEYRCGGGWLKLAW